MTTSDGVTLRHPPIPMADAHSRLDIDTISILSSQSDSVPHLSSYIESDDEGKNLVGSHSSHSHDPIAQSSTSTSHSQQATALTKDWAMYLTKSNNSNNGKHRHHHHHHQHHPNESSSETSDSDDDQSSSSVDDEDDSEPDFNDDPWTINPVQREYYTKQFRNLQSDISKVISGHIAKEFFERSRLPTSELSQIWSLSDVNRDGALSLAEFCTAMHLVVLRVNGFELPDELPSQLQPYTPLIDLSDTATTILPQPTIIQAPTESTEKWATFKDSTLDESNLNSPTQIPKQFTYVPPMADNHRIVAPVALRLSPPAPLAAPVSLANNVKPPPPPPRAPGRTASIDIPSHPVLPPRTLITETPQRTVLQTNPNSSTTSTPYLYNRARPSITSTPQHTDATNVLLGQIRDLLQFDHLQEFTTILSTPSMITTENLQNILSQIKSRNSVLKAQLKHWEDRLTDLIDKRISLELQLKLQQQQQQQQ